ncbi:ABC transporter substrate-binding protein [Cryobacterium sp. PH31-O1]|uniref:ABC transporter substrate-binding protein n=1 Tax=Cryobacterium sp. PH31-O1 TaxID=3046306 RepID=UPI0024B9F727|nr:ABC transporter substrate-binding protein [Cryobacterium sp. PH31-O1]MDJ0339380.1 ABC transporter substrate-binding protein [Cryobacterium sp. PH31-O1]
MTFSRKLTLLGSGTVLAALLLSGCSTGTGDEGSGGGRELPTGDEVTTTADSALHALLPEDIVKKGKIDIAVDIPFPPMAMFDDNNRKIGFDPELGRLLGQKLDIDVSLNKQAFDSVIPSLQAKKNDIIMSGMNDTPERQETLRFVDYSMGGFAILVPEGNPKKVGTQLDLCGKTVAVQKATVQGDLLRQMDCGSSPVTVMELPLDTDAQTALRAGKSDAYVADAVVAEYVAVTVEDGKAFEVVRDPKNPAGFNPVYSGIGILQDRSDLIDAVQQALQALIDDGSYQAVLERNNIAAYAIESAEVNRGAAQ